MTALDDIRSLLVHTDPRLTEPQAGRRLAALLTDLSEAECEELGFSFDLDANGARLGALEVFNSVGHGLPDGTLWLHLSPGGTHRALLWDEATGNTSGLWLNGQPVAEPGDPSGLHPHAPGHWVDEKVYVVHVSGPMAGRGLLLADALSGRTQIERPDPGETWDHPVVSRAAPDTFHLFANARHQQDVTPARTVHL